MTDNMDCIEGVAGLQRKQVMNLLLDLLKSCYPAQHEYLLLRAEQYESMCYTRASTIQHYYQLVNEGVSKIRDAYNGQLAAAVNPAAINFAGQKVNAGMRDALTSVKTSSHDVTRTSSMVNQAVKTMANHVSNPINSAVPINPLAIPTSATGVALNPVSQQVNQIPTAMESYMVNPVAALNLPTTPVREQLANPTFSRMIRTQAPSVRNPPINSMGNTMGNYVVNPTGNPSLNQGPPHMPLNQAVNPTINPVLNTRINQIINQTHGQMYNQMINQKANPGQSPSRDPALMANQTGMAEINQTSNLPHDGDFVTTPIEMPGHQPQNFQPQSEGVNQFLLSMGMIPTSMIADAHSSVADIQGIPMGNSNKVRTVPQAHFPALKQALTPQNTVQANATMLSTHQIPVSGAETVSSRPRSATRALGGKTSSRGTKPNSASSSGSRGIRYEAKTFQRSRSKKRNSSTAGIDQQINPPASVQRIQRQMASKKVSNLALTVAAAPSQALFQSIPHTQRQADSTSAHLPRLEEQLSLSHPSMNERVFISDSIHVSLGQVYIAAASCGYKLTAKTIKSLSKDQMLRFFTLSRQMALKKACDLPRRENGQINVSKQYLDAIGVQYRTIQSTREQAGNSAVNLNGVQKSTSQIVRHASVPANMKMNRNDMMTRTGNSQSVADPANGSRRSTPLDQDSSQVQSYSKRNTAQELPNHQDFGQAGRANDSVRRKSSCRGPVGSVSQRTGNLRALQCQNNTSNALVVSSTGLRANSAQGVGNLPNTSSPAAAQAENISRTSVALSTQQVTAGVRTSRNYAAPLSYRVTLFQQKYAVYKELINQTLSCLLRMGHEGQNQVLYLRYSMQLLTRPAAMGPALTLDVLNTTENFLRDFLVRYRRIPMKSEPEQSNQTDSSKAGELVMNADNLKKASIAQAGASTQAQNATTAHIEKGAELMRTTKNESDHQAFTRAGVRQSNAVENSQDSPARRNSSSVIPCAQTFVPSKPVPNERTHNMNLTATALPAQNIHSVIAQKVNRVNHYVRMALHATEKCEKKLEEEPMLRLKEERISEVCYVFQADNMKKARELKRIAANAEGASELSLLEIVKVECEDTYKKHKKLMINIAEKWNKPVVECLLAYQSIRLPKIVIHVGGTYRKDRSTSFGFERPPFGWVSVLGDIKRTFNTLMEHREGVSGVLEAWATAAEEILKDEHVHKQ